MRPAGAGGLPRPVPAVRAVQIEKWLGQTRVLAGVSLELPAGGGLAILGPNGAGKSTLLKVLAGLMAPSAGRIEWWGLPSARHGPGLRRRLGVVLQEPMLYPELTPLEHLALSARLYGLSDPADRIREMLEWAGLQAYARRRVGRLSRGMQQRLALARAFLHQPDVLLLDEPATALDEEARAALVARVAEVRAAGAALLLVTHDREQAAALCDSWLLLDGGRVREAGTF